jgi:hypothetical protein
MSFLPLVRIWIWISVLASVAGWTLSTLGQLNRGGYAVFCGLVLAGYVLLRRKFRSAAVWKINWKKVSRRFRRGLPACFAVLAFLVFLGGVIYAPSNHTALTYRTPRVLHWLAEGHWHWIHTPDYRMNNRACGIEWMSAPLLLFTKSDRGLFLLNFIPFLLLPGLLFSVCTRLGVRGRVAWQWMWLMPTGYTFLLQAGSAGNDAFPTVYALAAVDFGCRAWGSGRIGDLWLSLLSAALLTGAKASNLPLLLPWGILMLAVGVRWWRDGRKWELPRKDTKNTKNATKEGSPVGARGLQAAGTGLVVLLAVMVSFLPTAALNIRYCGDWSGLKLERKGMDMKDPVVGIWGNALLLSLNNFAPPFFPQAARWNRSALRVMPQALVAPMVENFEQGFQMLGEMPTEDWVGIGFGVSTLMAVAGAASLCRFPRKVDHKGNFARTSGRANTMLHGGYLELPVALRWCVLIAPWLALLAYCMKSGMVTGARLISPYYPLLLPLLLIGKGQGELIRHWWWRALVWGVLLLALPVLVLTPGRPLWPARTVLSRAMSWKHGHQSITRALSVYTVYANRPDPLAAMRALLPAGLNRVGFMGTEDDIDISLWRPFGQRRVEHILLDDPAEAIRQRNLQHVVVGGFYLASNTNTLDAWVQRVGGAVLATNTATLKVSEGPQEWYLVRLSANGSIP